MKNLVICSNESIVSGAFITGIGEVSDSLAIALSKNYNVTVVCPDGNGRIANFSNTLNELFDGVRCCTFLGVRFLLIATKEYEVSAIEFAKPDILLNFGDIDLINRLENRPNRAVCVLDFVNEGEDIADGLSQYDEIITVSNGYAQTLLSRRDSLSSFLQTKNFRGITNGILSGIFSPEKGVMLPVKYSHDNLGGKAVCKKRLCEQYGLPYDRYIAVMMGRLIETKGVDGVIDNIRNIYENGGYTLIIGNGDEKYMSRLDKMKRSDGVLWLKNKVSPPGIIPILAGADFLLYPSLMEACGLMPMTACRYGTIPVTTLNGGLADNMNDDIAIIISNMNEAPSLMKDLYFDNDRLIHKQKEAMKTDFSWRTRKQGYLEVLQ